MGTKVKKKKGIVALLGKEEQDVRYDIIKHSLWIMVRCLFVLNAVWYGILLLHEYGSFQKTLAEILAAPAMLLAVAFLFERCAEHFNLPLYDGVVLLIMDCAVLVVLAGDRWSRRLLFLCVLPVIFCMILKDIRLVYLQIAVSIVMIFVNFALVEMTVGREWKDNVWMNLTGMLYTAIVIARVVVQIRKYTHMLNIQTTIDSLTRLHNHEAFYRRLDRKFTEYKKNKEPLCILIADIDNFKRVNDTYGHAYGDKVLKVLAGIFLEEENSRCFAARYGGEEFAMIMDMSQQDAVTKAEVIRSRFEQQQIPTDSGPSNSFTVSVGVAVCGEIYQTSRQFFEKADEAMYRAKAGGKNRVCL